jgi:hypothetical protein
LPIQPVLSLLLYLYIAEKVRQISVVDLCP